MTVNKGLAVKIKKSVVGFLLALVLTLTPNSAFAGSLHTAKSPAVTASKSAVPKPKISNSFLNNRLTASIGKVKKSSLVSYQWIRNGGPIPGETNKSYEWKASDCSQDIQVLVTVKEKGKKESSKLSSAYNPNVCQYTTGDLPAWSILHECGIDDGIPSSIPDCSEYINGPPGAFWGFAFRKTVGQPWFRVSFPEIDPNSVISWRASATGLFQSYTRSLRMIAKNEPSWACCDFKQTVPATSYTGTSMSPPEVMGLSSDRSAYIGFNFYDPWGLSESLVVDTIRVTIKFNSQPR
jgi:hypothetical protein